MQDTKKSEKQMFRFGSQPKIQQPESMQRLKFNIPAIQTSPISKHISMAQMGKKPSNRDLGLGNDSSRTQNQHS